MKIKTHNIFLMAVCVFSLSCTNPTSKKEIIKETLLTNDSVDRKVECYTPDGKQLIRSFFLKDTLVHGRFVEYFANGKLSYEGDFVYEKKIGTHIYYDSVTNKAKKKIVYQLLKDGDSLISRVNMIFNFDGNGTLIDSASVGYLEVLFNDTIKQGEDFDFGFKLLNPYYKKADFILCDFDQNYIKRVSTPCETIKVKNQMVILSTKKYELGKNTIRGIIECYESIDRPKNDSSFVTIYYEKNFFVVP